VLLATACNRLHQIQEQYCRWVLMTRDRTGSDEFTLTQDAIARILGVRRVSITAAARQLRKQGLIDYRRGTLKILDRSGLEKASCECYARANAVYQAILPVAPQVMQTSCRIA
jgi:Mn-dependent DtxR family transcriptional regulator